MNDSLRQLSREFALLGGESFIWAARALRTLVRHAFLLPSGSDIETRLLELEAWLAKIASAPETDRHLTRLMNALAVCVRSAGVPPAILGILRRWQRSVDRRGNRNAVYAAVRPRLQVLSRRDPILAYTVLWPIEVQVNGRESPVVNFGRDCMRAVVAWQKYQAGRNREARAGALINAAPITCEGVYKQYLQILWRLRRVEERGELGRAPTMIGQLVAELGSGHDDTVNTDAVFLRNAIGHQGWLYVPARNAVRLWNLSRTGEITRQEERPVADVAATVRSFLDVGIGVVDLLRQAALFDIVLETGVAQSALDAIAAVGVKRSEEIRRDLEAAFAQLQTTAGLAPRRAGLSVRDRSHMPNMV